MNYSDIYNSQVIFNHFTQRLELVATLDEVVGGRVNYDIPASSASSKWAWYARTSHFVELSSLDLGNHRWVERTHASIRLSKGEADLSDLNTNGIMTNWKHSYMLSPNYERNGRNIALETGMPLYVYDVEYKTIDMDYPERIEITAHSEHDMVDQLSTMMLTDHFNIMYTVLGEYDVLGEPLYAEDI